MTDDDIAGQSIVGGHRPPLQFQNTNFNAICMIRGSPAARIRPKVASLRVVLIHTGAPCWPEMEEQGFTWFATLNASARNSTFCLSPSGNVRTTPVSNRMLPGPVTFAAPIVP